MFSSLEKTVLGSNNILGLPIEETFQPKMNADNDNTEHSVDLGLALGYSGQCTRKALNNDSGAGANAGSRVDMTFVATDPLSELVWSPDKGLSLKCADSSANEKRPSLLWGTGPSNMICSPPQSITARKTIPDEPGGEGNLVTSEATVRVKYEMGEADILTCPRSNAVIITVDGLSQEPKAGTSGNNDEMTEAVQVSALDVNQEPDQGDSTETGIHAPLHIPTAVNSKARGKKVSGFSGMKLGCMADSLSFKMNENEPDRAQIESLPMQFNQMISSNPTGGNGDDGSGSQTLGMEAVLTTEVPPVKQCKTPKAPVLNSTTPFRRNEGLALAAEEESNDEMKTHGSTSNPLEKPESAAENDFRTETVENACGAVSKRMASASDRDAKITSQHDEGMLPEAKALLVNNSPNKSGIYRHRRKGKGKGKALSGGDRSGRKSNKEDDSDESVESCNSAALFSTGKKRWGCEQQLITGSKRIREQINGSPGSTSYVRQDSSFMSWISNMMKGLSKSNQDQTPSLALTFARPNHDSYDQKLVPCNKNEDPGCRNMGFQSIFQSLYCPTTKVQQSRTLNADNETGEGSKEVYLANKLCDVDITPVACHGKNSSFKKALLSTEKLDQSIFGNGSGPSTLPKVLSAKFSACQENYKTSYVENRSASNPVSGAKIDGVSSSSSSLGKRKTNSAENNDSDPPSVGKTTHNFGYKRNLLGSLWVTRFSPKTSTPILNVDHCHQNTGGATELSTDCMGIIPYSQNRFDSFKGLKILKTREYCTEEPLTIVGAELQNCSGGAEVSFGFQKNSAHNSQNSIYKWNPILPSQRFESSGAMASIFARRLDAFKHIMTLNATDNEDSATSTCFFCGIRGHSIHDCSEIKETELEDLLRNRNSYFGAEEPPCFCIRCFQLNHWAVACPNVLKRQNQSECDAALVNQCSSGTMLHATGDKRNWEPLGSKENPPQVAVAFGVCSGRKHAMQTGCNLNEKGNGNMTTVKLYSNSNPVKRYTASSSGEINSKGRQMIPLCNFVNPQISDVPKRIFDAIKRLRLSRGDILKWMNAVSPFSHLNGFFLRLRLGKWEEGLGGTGYYVACISGAQKERPSQSSKNPIAVNVGGIKCLVESQYVSNQDFLEDELMAWWGATTRAGGKIPSEEDLKVKLEERKKLGF